MVAESVIAGERAHLHEEERRRGAAGGEDAVVRVGAVEREGALAGGTGSARAGREGSLHEGRVRLAVEALDQRARDRGGVIEPGEIAVGGVEAEEAERGERVVVEEAVTEEGRPAGASPQRARGCVPATIDEEAGGALRGGEVPGLAQRARGVGEGHQGEAVPRRQLLVVGGRRRARAASRDEAGERARPGLVESGRADLELAGDGDLVAAVEHAAPVEGALARGRDPEERAHAPRVRGAERGLELRGREGVVGALADGIVGVEADDEAAVGALPGGHEVVQHGAAHAFQLGIAEGAARLEEERGELGVVVEGLLEVRHVPAAIDRVAMEGAGELIADAAAAQVVEGEREVAPHVVDRSGGRGRALDPAQLGEEQRRVGELLVGAEAAEDLIARRAEREHGDAEHVLVQLAARGSADRPRRRSGRAARGPCRGEARGVVVEALVDLAEHVGEAGAAPGGHAREVRPAEDGLEVGREDHGERPARRLAEARDGVDEERVEVGAGLAVDLDGDEARVEEARGVVVLEGLLLHHVAPVAGGVAHGDEDEAALATRPLEGLGAPRVPVDGVVRVLLQVRARLPDEVVALAADERDRPRGLCRRVRVVEVAGGEEEKEGDREGRSPGVEHQSWPTTRSQRGSLEEKSVSRSTRRKRENSTLRRRRSESRSPAV